MPSVPLTLGEQCVGRGSVQGGVGGECVEVRECAEVRE